jgi:hypothetical protein
VTYTFRNLNEYHPNFNTYFLYRGKLIIIDNCGPLASWHLQGLRNPVGNSWAILGRCPYYRFEAPYDFDEISRKVKWVWFRIRNFYINHEYTLHSKLSSSNCYVYLYQHSFWLLSNSTTSMTNGFYELFLDKTSHLP